MSPIHIEEKYNYFLLDKSKMILYNIITVKKN